MQRLIIILCMLPQIIKSLARLCLIDMTVIVFKFVLLL